MSFGARPSTTQSREEQDRQVARALVSALGILKAEPLRITHVRDGQDFLMSGPRRGGPGQSGNGGFGFPAVEDTGSSGVGGEPPPLEEPVDPEIIDGGSGGGGGPGPVGPAGPPGPQGPTGPQGDAASVNGYIDFVHNVTYDASSGELRIFKRKIFGQFENSGTDSQKGIDHTGVETNTTAIVVTTAQECQ